MTSLQFVAKAEFDRVRRLNAGEVERAAVFADLCRINTLSMIMKAGSGHIGSSFSCLDIVSWLHLNEMRPLEGRDGYRDVYFSSKGHDAPALYSVLIALGLLPQDQARMLRRLGGLPGHPDVATMHIPANTGSLGMGVSKAKGIAWANRRARFDAHIYVLTGDGELQEGQFWESLVSAANGGYGEITAIVDHNKVQSDTWVDRTSDLGDLAAKFAAFGWHVARCDGHDLAAVAAALRSLRAVEGRPKVLIADTIKGRGISFMEHTGLGRSVGDLYKFHSGAPSVEHYRAGIAELSARVNARLAALGAAPARIDDEAWEGKATPPANPQRLVAAYSRALVDEATRNSKIVALDADLVLDTGLIPFRERFPDRFVECGIAEQDMVSQAGGMALAGLHPVVHSFACFLSTRPNEQIYNNATERKCVTYVGSLAGLVPAGPGHSHQSVRDIALFANVPGLVALEPSCDVEVALAVDFCLNRCPGSSYLRLISIPYEIAFTLPSGYKLEEGRGVVVHDGDDAVLFTYGPVLLSQAVIAAQALCRDHGVTVRVVNMPWLNRVDGPWLAEQIRGARHVFTVDNHYVAGGQGEFLAARLAAEGPRTLPPVTLLGLFDIPACGTNQEALAAHGLDAAGLTRSIAAAMGVRADKARRTAN